MGFLFNESFFFKSDSLRLKLIFSYRGQLQVLLQIELYILANATKTKVDDDWVWEIANSIRWLSQHFKEKFKIEKFLFGEIYATYHPILPDFIISLMEELGYDKEDNNDTDDNAAQSSLNSSSIASASGSPLATPVKESPLKSSQPSLPTNTSVTVFATSFISQYSNLTFTGGISSLFEDLSSQTIQNSQTANANASSIFNDSNENDDNNNTTITNNHSHETGGDDILDEFRKKKT